ncbi:MAG: TrmH family RNA methyltransferase [Candidatus Nomurabacteria bacterium]|jgi:tRNA G18 (ribose-2'-O)-methylase SpoU|nr:TrmH family RNA methyltransferase [Candidatus Nomurabacteria bacterium]
MEIVLILHNIRSVHNVGSIFRTADGFGVSKIYLSGYTPNWHDALPHVQAKILRQIYKTALGAEKIVVSEYVAKTTTLIKNLRASGFRIVGLEQDPHSVRINEYSAPKKVALLLGEEVHGIEPNLRDLCDDLVEIQMRGQKESFNVSVATGIALYELRR